MTALRTALLTAPGSDRSARRRRSSAIERREADGLDAAVRDVPAGRRRRHLARRSAVQCVVQCVVQYAVRTPRHSRGDYSRGRPAPGERRRSRCSPRRDVPASRAVAAQAPIPAAARWMPGQLVHRDTDCRPLNSQGRPRPWCGHGGWGASVRSFGNCVWNVGPCPVGTGRGRDRRGHEPVRPSS